MRGWVGGQGPTIKLISAQQRLTVAGFWAELGNKKKKTIYQNKKLLKLKKVIKIKNNKSR